ncbi:uncharacterized protein LOC131014560 isoform X1 [Salvia miltiorrhiza]|uniref:uncharacterized protein LOC131014560 isoform X1 n=1 Tax=Salvia miltiorrhiza TaxID=226208 RepID=UPI0025ACFED0|nr:uncharacterized protein LOC131014560 isoform X1 [Salvia miltiorrhiza]
MMAMLTLIEANEKLIPKKNCMRDAVDLLLKAEGYLNFYVLDVLPQLAPEIKCIKSFLRSKKLPSDKPLDMQGHMLEAILHQALAQVEAAFYYNLNRTTILKNRHEVEVSELHPLRLRLLREKKTR